MKLTVIQSDDNMKNEFISFNTRIYFERETTNEQSCYKWNITQVDQKRNKHLVAMDENSIIGQIILMPVNCFFKGEKLKSVFGYDYVVDPGYLNTGVGVKLLSKTIKENIHFGIGVSEISRKLHLVLREKSVGNIYKYLFFRNFTAYFFIGLQSYFKIDIRKKIPNTGWPGEVGGVFYKSRLLQKYPSQEMPFNKDLIEFGRDENFTTLRFGKEFKAKYGIYEIVDKNNNLKGHFAARAERWRGINILIVSDYRYAINDEDVLDHICYSSKSLMKVKKLDAVLFGSSLHIIDERLGKNKFKKVGVPSEIFTNLSLTPDELKKKATQRELIFATPADSDFEFNLGNNLWKR